MEKLKVHQLQELVHRLRSDQPVRAISRDMGCSRNTVRCYARWAQSHGLLDPGRSLPSLAELEQLQPSAMALRSSNVSSVAPYGAIVEQMLRSGADVTAIHRKLRNSHGYQGSYTSVRRYACHLASAEVDAFVRIETAPGEVAQVDFGTVGRAWDAARRCVRTVYCFVMTLCWSRHMFVRFVFDQTMPTWLECHRSAFEWFGGVTKEVVIDNLKTAVLRAALEDCVLSVPYERFARHYGFLVHPCRPGTPRHKGKVENGVGYVKGAFWKSEPDCLDLGEYNRRVLIWATEEAGLRRHGTTRQAPVSRFLSEERALLMPLPETPCDLEIVVHAKVHRDCHVQVQGRYYSAPFAYVGKSVDVHVYFGIVQLFDGVQLLVTHPRARDKGERITRMEHYPPEKSIYLVRTRSWCMEQAVRIGPSCHELVKRLLDSRPLDKLRAAQGIMGLADSFGHDRVEAACARATHYGDPSYRRVKSILVAGADRQPMAEEPQLRLVDFAFARSAQEFFTEEETA